MFGPCTLTARAGIVKITYRFNEEERIRHGDDHSV
jgi:hypothetical protein